MIIFLVAALFLVYLAGACNVLILDERRSATSALLWFPIVIIQAVHLYVRGSERR